MCASAWEWCSAEIKNVTKDLLVPSTFKSLKWVKVDTVKAYQKTMRLYCLSPMQGHAQNRCDSQGGRYRSTVNESGGERKKKELMILYIVLRVDRSRTVIVVSSEAHARRLGWCGEKHSRRIASSCCTWSIFRIRSLVNLKGSYRQFCRLARFSYVVQVYGCIFLSWNTFEHCHLCVVQVIPVIRVWSSCGFAWSVKIGNWQWKVLTHPFCLTSHCFAVVS